MTNSFNSASTTYIYPASSNVVQTYTTIRDTQSPTVSSKLLDGAGRVRATAAEHPGSTGGYVGQYFVFDVMGRQTQQTNPTEIYGSWQPAGDDAAGWNWTVQSYDWKGRPRVSTNQDGTTKEATYGGCGCAGGEIVTMRDEVNRYSKVYHDVLGRVTKSEELNWDQTCLSHDNNTYNALDQVTSSSVQEGSAGTAQTSTFAFDGYGRVATSHAPIQPNNSVTSYSYNPDDTIATTKDAREALATFTYNKRHQTTEVSYWAPSGITSAPTANFTYDAAGNRTTMTDGLGSVSYQYDPLSRMTSESRVFSSLGSTPYTLTYAYNLAGQLTSITDPWNAQVGYTRDIIGRLTAVTGSGYPNIPQAGYASQLQYRAWGALKSMTYGNGVPISLSYNNRLQVSHYTLTSTSTNIPSPSMDINYSYSADGRLKLSTDNRDATLDRAYKYDQVGRLVEAFTASEARSWVQTGNIGTTEDGPYRQSYTLDPWDNMGTKWGRSFTGTHRRTQTVTRYYDALTGRVNGWGYDNAGNITSGDYVMNSYDAAGRLRQSDGNDTVLGRFEYDGDGVKTKSQTEAAYVFLLRSSVLGQTLEEIQTSDGTRWNGFVYADGELIATQAMGLIYWQHRDPSQRSTRTTDANQEGVGHDELDPNGSKVDIPGGNHYNHGSGGGHILGSGGIAARVASLMDIRTCSYSTMAVPCSMVANFRQHIQNTSQSGVDHWNGIANWTLTVTDKFYRRFNHM